MSTFGMTGAAQMLQAGARSQGRDLSLEDAHKQLSATHKRNNAQIKPSDQGLRELNDYIAKHYPNGNVPRHLREAATMAQSGGINDMGVSMRVQGDIGNRTRGTGSGAATNPLGAGARLANAPSGPLAQFYGANMPGHLANTLNEPVAVAKAQDAERLGPTGLPGWLRLPLALAAYKFGGPALGGMFGAATSSERGPMSVLGASGGFAAQSGALAALKGAGGLSRSGVPSNGGTVSNVNSFMPNWAQSGAAAGAAGGGSGVGVFNALSGFMNNNQWVGQLASAGLNLAGSRQASNQMTKAADRAFQSSQFQPYNISGPQGGASFNGRNATGHLSPEMQRVAKDQLGVAKGALRGYNRFNPDKFANEAYRTMANYVEPQNTQDTNEYLSDIYNTGAWGSTTGARDIFSLQRARQAEDNMFRLQSQQLGAAESDRLFNNYFKSIGSYANTLGIPYGMIDQGMGGGAQASAANVNANQYSWMAARNSADASAAFWSSMGSVVQNYGNSRNRYQAGLHQQRGSSVTPQMPGNNSTPWW